MHCIIAFFCRTLLLTIYIVLGRRENDAVPLDMLDRMVVTCLQACLLGAAWVVFEACAFVIRVLSRTRAYTPLPVVLAVRATTDRVRREAPADASAQDKTPQEDADSDAHIDGMDTASHASLASLDEPPATRVVFDSREALARYVAKVHIIGVVVWTTMLSIDYVLTQTSFLFALGMLCGNVAWVLSGPHGRAGMPTPVLALYWSISLALIVLYLLHDGASALESTETELGMTPNRIEWSQTGAALVVLLSPASCGFTWTFWIDARTLLAHYHTSLYTSVILSVPVLLFVRGTYLADILSRYSTPWLTHVVLIEPVLKFMTIYTMTLSLDAESVVEMLTVNTSVVGACYLFFEPHDTSYNATVAVLVAALIALHLARLTRRALRECRSRQPPAFVVGDN